ncbi:hypothetical protein Ccrd_026539, partial [Cynara cardunculus var. scolymus]
MTTKESPPPAASAPVMTSCRRKKSEDATFLQDEKLAMSAAGGLCTSSGPVIGERNLTIFDVLDILHKDFIMLLHLLCSLATNSPGNIMPTIRGTEGRGKWGHARWPIKIANEKNFKGFVSLSTTKAGVEETCIIVSYFPIIKFSYAAYFELINASNFFMLLMMADGMKEKDKSHDNL